jgi:hypothetical protein
LVPKTSWRDDCGTLLSREEMTAQRIEDLRKI